MRVGAAEADVGRGEDGDIRTSNMQVGMSTSSLLMEKLLALGEPEIRQNWLDCASLGIGPVDIPELVRLVSDDRLHDATADSGLVWVPVHAWRALAQLHAAEAAEPLTRLLRRIDEKQDDWIGEEMPLVFGMIGPPAIPALAQYLQNARNPDFARVAAIHGLQLIGSGHAASRDEVAAILSNQLGKFRENDATINAFLISHLIDLGAVEAASLMKQAYDADRVDSFVLGDWEDAQIELGIKFTRETPRPLSPLELLLRRQPASQDRAPQSRPLTRQARRKAERDAARLRKRKPRQC